MPMLMRYRIKQKWLMKEMSQMHSILHIFQNLAHPTEYQWSQHHFLLPLFLFLFILSYLFLFCPKIYTDKNLFRLVVMFCVKCTYSISFGKIAFFDFPSFRLWNWNPEDQRQKAIWEREAGHFCSSSHSFYIIFMVICTHLTINISM